MIDLLEHVNGELSLGQQRCDVRDVDRLDIASGTHRSRSPFELDMLSTERTVEMRDTLAIEVKAENVLHGLTNRGRRIDSRPVEQGLVGKRDDMRLVDDEIRTGRLSVMA